MTEVKKAQHRERYGLRFLKKHEIKWVVSAETLKRQASLSLMGRVEHFRQEFPTAKMNPTLLRKVYQIHGIKKKKIRWVKSSPLIDQNDIRQ